MICWLIVVMQFLWRYVDELVGKGLDVWIILQIIFYAAMSFLPMALPLGILLGSLMFFGNMGERLELLAMKASGMSLYRMMRPLFATVSLLAVGLFIFQNDFMITSQVRMWTLLYSARFSNPELEIPERIFYNGINGFSIYAKERDRVNKGRMLDLMIYAHNNGTENTRIIRADSGRIVMDDSKTYVTWRLYSGQSFENLGRPEGYMDEKPISHAKERFEFKEIVIPFDANFQKMGEETMSNMFVGKNLNQLQSTFDSVSMQMDSIRSVTQTLLTDLSYSQRYSTAVPTPRDTSQWAMERLAESRIEEPLSLPHNIDSIVRITGRKDSLLVLSQAINQMRSLQNETETRLYSDQDVFTEFRTNGQEWHRKFTFPAACLVFFFIGAPLGAIIRKGGIGMPIVASVLFFIIYYIIDTFGFNMTKNESLPVWFGMWLSAMVLFPIGMFLTYKASLDSNILNADIYVNLWRRLNGTHIPLRNITPLREAVEPSYVELREQTRALLDRSEDMLASKLMNRSIVHAYRHSALYHEAVAELHRESEALVERLRHVHHPLILTKTNDIPVLPQRLVPFLLPDRRGLQWLLLLCLPVSVPLLLVLRIYRERLRNSLRAMNVALSELVPMIEGGIRE